MVRNVRFISWLSTYADLKYLLDNSMLQSFPLVDAPGKYLRVKGQMIWEKCGTLVKFSFAVQ